jgi:hypothetical protein
VAVLVAVLVLLLPAAVLVPALVAAIAAIAAGEVTRRWGSCRVIIIIHI